MARLVLAAVLFALFAVPAEAAETRVAKYRGFTLHAEEKGNRVCMTLRRERRYQGVGCGRIPRSPHRPVSIFADVGFNNYAAAVSPSVRSAEAEYPNGRRQRIPTFGRRGFESRFVIAPSAATFIRFFRADGTLIGIDGGRAGYIDIFENTVQLTGDREAGVSAHTELRLAPLPGAPERMRTLACVDVTGSTGGTGLCDDRADNVLALMGGCGEAGHLGAIVAAGVAGLRVTLGSGADVFVPAIELPAVFGGRRAISAPLPAGEAIRAATAVDAAGAGVAAVAVGLAPGQPCAGEDRGDDRFLGRLQPVTAPPTVAVGGQLVVGDQGERLCVALREPVPHTCAFPPVDSDQPRLHRLGTSVGGALSGDADRITLELDRGADVTVSAAAAPAYTGRWAAFVRFFTAQVPERAEVTRAVVRNAAGRIIGISGRGLPRPAERRRELVDRGGLGLELVQREGKEACVTPFGVAAASYCTVRNPGTPIDGPIRRYQATIAVACAPRAAIAYGRIPDAQRTPEVVLEGGVVRATRIKLPDEDAWIAYLPDARVLGLRAGGEEAVALDLPPASAACGYSADRSF